MDHVLTAPDASRTLLGSPAVLHLRGLRTLRWALAPLVVLGCQPSRDAPARTLELAPCHVEGLDASALCGTLEVPLDHADPEDARIGLRVAVVPARREPRPDPVFLLAGGPGQGAVNAYAPVLSLLRELNRDRDIVLVDQRGTGESAPLRCERDDDDLRKLLDPTPDPERTLACRSRYEGLEHYLTPTAMDDLDLVRASLGYPQINLIGGSYGTRAALVYARQHPEHVRTMVLDGVAPVDMAIPQSFAADAQASFDRLVAACKRHPACAERFADPAADLDAILDRLAREPAEVVVPHPRTAVPTELTLSRDAVALGVRGLLYAPTVAGLLPLALAKARDGDYAPLVTQMALVGDSMAETMSEGLTMSVLCAEDVPFVDREAARADTTTTFVGAAVVETMSASCETWGVDPIDDAYREPVASDVPTLLLSGELDPVTPPRWAARAARTLSRSREVVVPGAGHGTITIPCVTGMVTRFVDAADPEVVDAACLDRLGPPPFVIDPSGPTP